MFQIRYQNIKQFGSGLVSTFCLQRLSAAGKSPLVRTELSQILII